METTQVTFDHILPENPMGEACKDAPRLDFVREFMLEFHATKVTSDGGLLACRLDDTLSLISVIDSELRDIGTGKNIQHGLAALLRQSRYSRFAGYDDTNDAERLAVDPAMRHLAGDRAVKHSTGSTRHWQYVLFQMAEVMVPMALFPEILERIGRLRASPELGRAA